MVPYRNNQRIVGYGIGRPRRFGRPYPFLTGVLGGLALGALARPPLYPPYPYAPYHSYPTYYPYY